MLKGTSVVALVLALGCGAASNEDNLEPDACVDELAPPRIEAQSLAERSEVIERAAFAVDGSMPLERNPAAEVRRRTASADDVWVGWSEPAAGSHLEDSSAEPPECGREQEEQE